LLLPAVKGCGLLKVRCHVLHLRDVLVVKASWILIRILSHLCSCTLVRVNPPFQVSGRTSVDPVAVCALGNVEVYGLTPVISSIEDSCLVVSLPVVSSLYPKRSWLAQMHGRLNRSIDAE
jgi:hypothetical protein